MFDFVFCSNDDGCQFIAANGKVYESVFWFPVFEADSVPVAALEWNDHNNEGLAPYRLTDTSGDG